MTDGQPADAETNVLVTGGTGVIGSQIIRQLLDQDDVASPVIYDWQPDTRLIADVQDRVRIERGDIRDLPRLLRVIQDHDIERVIHTAAIMPEQAAENPAQGVDVNFQGTVNVLEAARIEDLDRVVYCSSKAAYGPVNDEHGYPDYEPMTEEHSSDPTTVYGLTKFASERLGVIYHDLFSVDFIACRFASTYSPGKLARHGAVAFACRLIESAMAGEPFELESGGDEVDDWVYNKDVARGLVLACTVDDTDHRVFNIGSGQGVTPKEVAEILEEKFPEAELDIGDGRDYYGLGVPYYYVYDLSRARKELGYEPKYDIRAGIEDYVETMHALDIEPLAPTGD